MIKRLIQPVVSVAEALITPPITFVMNAVKQMTSQTQCDGSDKRIVGLPQVHNSNGTNYQTGDCPVCEREVPIRLMTTPARSNSSGIQFSAHSAWVTLPHDKPFVGHCADCHAGLYENDYLCERCRRASLRG